ncbi:MAG TPA: complex I subunit 1 family protein, partial [Candidatus Acidoferrum sp.]|nr:complex I subunit 1 family protein [Candidatus Acidoferrum sp.]
MRALTNLLFFPGGLFLIALALAYEFVDRKLIARFQNRVGPRWFQTVADIVKLLIKEEITPATAHPILFRVLPVAAMSGVLTAALYVPLLGLAPALSFRGDLIVTLYLLSLLTMCIGMAGWNSTSRFTMLGATRALTQLFSYEAPFMLALLGPAIVAGSWQISDIVAANNGYWILLTQPFGFVVAMIGLMGKLEMPPFDAPKAKSEIVAGALTEYSGRGLGLFSLGKEIELVEGLTLIACLYMGGIANPLEFFGKTA